MWSTPAVWNQYNKMAVLHFFLVNSPLIYILFSLDIPEYLYLLIDHVHSTVLVHNITCCGKYHRFQLISVTLLSLIWGKLILNWKSNLKNVLERKWVFATNSNFSLYILVTRWCRPLILETLNSGRSNFFWFTWFS